MDSRFAHMYKRDSSVSMIRLKMSRRRSQSQKENREKMQNLRRHLDRLPEAELSMDASVIVIPQDNPQKTKPNKDLNEAAEERRKMLARYKENKMLQKEKEKREKEKKGVFKVGLYKPQPLGFLPSNSAGPIRGKVADLNQSTRVTRSMVQNQRASERPAAVKKVEAVPTTRAAAKTHQKPLTATRGRIATVEPMVRPPTTRSASKPKPAEVAKPLTDSRAPKTRSAFKCPAAPLAGREKTLQGDTKPDVENKPVEKNEPVVDSVPPEEEEKPKVSSSFAPQNFVFQAPTGLKLFQSAPLSPRSASAFLSPSFTFEPSTEPTSSVSPKSVLPAPSVSSPPPSLPTPPAPSSPQPSASAAPSTPPDPSEPKHDVAYFRAEMASETERLTVLSELWEARFDDSSIPEEMRDLMRTAVGQARLLMKERFGQFSGLVDDCDLGRGEKITTCTDLQGFWDMVYFQVEDVNKKFNALKEAETREWKEEAKPAPKKRVVKKPPVPGGKAGTGTNAAAKSRLAAVKAAMKAKQAAEQKPTETSDKNQEESSSAPANTLPVQTVVFHGGFFQVESPVKTTGPVRRSSRITAVASPLGSKFSTPIRQRRSNAVSHATPLPSMSTTPSRNLQPDALPVPTPQRSAEPPQSPQTSQISPDRNQTSQVSPTAEPHTNIQPRFDLSPTCTSEVQPEISNEPANTLSADVDQSQVPMMSHDSPSQSKTALPVDSSEPCPQLVESMMFSPSSPKNTEEKMVSEEGLTTTTRAEACLEEVDVEPSVCGPDSPSPMPSTPTKDLQGSSALSNDVISACDSSSTITDVEMTGSHDAEGAADLDFERYLQPTARYSMSPARSLAGERFSLGAVDAEMESPVSQVEERPSGVLETPPDVGQSVAVHTREESERESETVSV